MYACRDGCAAKAPLHHDRTASMEGWRYSASSPAKAFQLDRLISLTPARTGRSSKTAASMTCRKPRPPASCLPKRLTMTISMPGSSEPGGQRRRLFQRAGVEVTAPGLGTAIFRGKDPASGSQVFKRHPAAAPAGYRLVPLDRAREVQATLPEDANGLGEHLAGKVPRARIVADCRKSHDGPPKCAPALFFNDREHPVWSYRYGRFAR